MVPAFRRRTPPSAGAITNPAATSAAAADAQAEVDGKAPAGPRARHPHRVFPISLDSAAVELQAQQPRRWPRRST